MNIYVISDTRNPRRRERTLDLREVCQHVHDKGLLHYVTHGGGVANSYGYTAVTDGVVVVRVDEPDQHPTYCVWAGNLPANKVTRSGVLATLVGSGFRGVADGRYSQDAAASATSRLLTHAKKAVKGGLTTV